MTLSPALLQTLTAAPKALQVPSSATGGTATLQQDQKFSTGAFNVGGASLNTMFLVLGGVALFLIFRKYK
jgi:hypothetical protein